MTDDHDVEHAPGYPAGESRTTAPQQRYTGGEVLRGVAVLLLGLAVVVGVPTLL
jgi:hypothetical protein